MLLLKKNRIRRRITFLVSERISKLPEETATAVPVAPLIETVDLTAPVLSFSSTTLTLPPLTSTAVPSPVDSTLPETATVPPLTSTAFPVEVETSPLIDTSPLKT